LRELDLDGALKNFYCGAADSGHQLLSALRDFYFDVARASHFFALQNVKSVRRGKPAMLDEISTQRSRGRTSAGVFIKFPGKHAAREGFAVVAASEAVGHGAVFSKQSS